MVLIEELEEHLLPPNQTLRGTTADSTTAAAAAAVTQRWAEQ